MTNDIWRRQEIESPCVKICVLHPDAKLCIGCYRTADEIARWSRFNPEERHAIMAELSTRSAMLPKRSGGRAARLKRRAGASEG